jgi:hypothetical protein
MAREACPSTRGQWQDGDHTFLAEWIIYEGAR